MNQQGKFVTVAAIIVAFILLAWGFVVIWDAPQQQGQSDFDTVSAEQLTSTDDATITDDLDVGGSITFQTANLYPMGSSTDNREIVWGTATFTGTQVVTTGLTAVTWAMCTMGEDPTAGAGDAAYCTVAVAGNAVTVKAWQDDFVTAATEASVDVHWLAIGTP